MGVGVGSKLTSSEEVGGLISYSTLKLRAMGHRLLANHQLSNWQKVSNSSAYKLLVFFSVMKVQF